MYTGPYENPKHYIGLSTDAKPVNADIGDIFFETDTRLNYICYDGTNWALDIIVGSSGVGVNEYRKAGSLPATTGTFNLPAVTTAGYGTLILGANLYSANFRVASTGAVQLIDSDAGGIIVANADTALKVAIGDAAVTDIIPITNRTADALTYILTFFYD